MEGACARCNGMYRSAIRARGVHGVEGHPIIELRRHPLLRSGVADIFAVT